MDTTQGFLPAPSCLRRLKGSQAAAGIVQAGEGLHRRKARCGTIYDLLVRSILHSDDQATDEGLQVAIRDALPLSPAKPTAKRPCKPPAPWRPELEKRLAVLATRRGEARGVDVADLAHIGPPGSIASPNARRFRPIAHVSHADLQLRCDVPET
jgi:hypothetical protein